MLTEAALNKHLYGDALDSGFERFMLSGSKRRRFSVRGLETIFMQHCRRDVVTDLIECGAADGSHTDMFLAVPRLRVHAFEPNIFLSRHWLHRLGNEYLKFNTFALAAERTRASFNIPIRNGCVIEGISSLSAHEGQPSRIVINVAVETAADYISDLAIKPNGLAIWIDTEGNADGVLAGFGAALSQVSVALIEVETGRYYDREPSFHAVMAMLAKARLQVVARDWMNEGQFNLLAFRPDDLHHAEHDLRHYHEHMMKLVEAYNLDNSTNTR